MNYIVKFWNGDAPLWVSYWIVGVLLSYPAGLIIGFAVGFFSSYFGFTYELMYSLIFIGLIAWYIFILVGIWRSAGKYQEHKYQGHKSWAVVLIAWAARISLIIGIISSLGNFFNRFVY